MILKVEGGGLTIMGHMQCEYFLEQISLLNNGNPRSMLLNEQLQHHGLVIFANM